MSYFHIWFQTKRRRKILVGEIDSSVHKLFSNIAIKKKYELLAYETMLDHAHLLVSLREDQSISTLVKDFKGISARRIFQEFPTLKIQARINNLWEKRYGCRDVPIEQLSAVARYIHNQKKDLEGL